MHHQGFDAVAEVARSRLNDFKSQELANTGCVFATACHASLLLLDAIEEVAQGRLKDFVSQGRLKDFVPITGIPPPLPSPFRHHRHYNHGKKKEKKSK